jgi:hypothetical protein
MPLNGQGVEQRVLLNVTMDWYDWYPYIRDEINRSKAFDALQPPLPGLSPQEMYKWHQHDHQAKAAISQHIPTEYRLLLPDNQHAFQWLQTLEHASGMTYMAKADQVINDYHHFAASAAHNFKLEGYLAACAKMQQRLISINEQGMATGAAFIRRCVLGLGKVPMFQPYILQWNQRPDAHRPQHFVHWCNEVRAYATTYRLTAGASQPTVDVHSLVKQVASSLSLQPARDHIAAAVNAVICFYCSKTGHSKRNCRSFLSDRQNSCIHPDLAGKFAGHAVDPRTGRRVDSSSSSAAPPSSSNGGGATSSSSSSKFKPSQGAKVVGAAVLGCASLVQGLHREDTIVDTGSGAGHLFNNEEMFETLEPCSDTVQFGAEAPRKISKMGRAWIETNGGWLLLDNVYYEPELPYNILSAEKLKPKFDWGKHTGMDTIFFTNPSKNDATVFSASLGASGMYTLFPPKADVHNRS